MRYTPLIALSSLLTTLQAQSTLSSLVFDTSGLTGSVTATYIQGTSGVPSATGAVTSSLSSLVFSTGDATGSMTIMPSTLQPSSVASASISSSLASVSSASSSSASSVSSAKSSSASSASASASSSAAAATSINAQPRVEAGGREAMGVAGLLAGIVALVV